MNASKEKIQTEKKYNFRNSKKKIDAFKALWISKATYDWYFFD